MKASMTRAQRSGRAFLGEPQITVNGWPIEIWIDPERRLVISHVTEPVIIDDVIANYYTDHFLAEIRKRIPEGAYDSVTDWSLNARYTTSARAKLTQWTMANRKDFRCLRIVMPPQNAIMRLGLSTATLALKAVGVDFEVKASLADVAQELGFDRPA